INLMNTVAISNQTSKQEPNGFSTLDLRDIASRETGMIPAGSGSQIRRRRMPHPWKTVIAVIATLVTLMLSLRIHQDGAPLASFLRFISRGALFGVIGTLTALTATALAAVLIRALHRKALSMQFIGVM